MKLTNRKIRKRIKEAAKLVAKMDDRTLELAVQSQIMSRADKARIINERS